jgi:fructose-bisphosphate aldolase class 1
LQENGVVPGIKTDSGLGFLPTGENYTFGLDKLETRIQEWYK